MRAPTNPFKIALSQSKALFGCWLGLASPISTELMGTTGFDWLVIDGEHGPNDLRSIYAQLQVLEASDSHAVVRVPIGETYLIKQILDAGAQTILVPMVETAEQASQLVRDVTYPPHGERGVGYAVARAGLFSKRTQYGTTADAEICLLVQVENLRGLENLDEILSVEGVDGVFIGPADLAADMGHMGDAMHPDVIDTILNAITRIKAAGKAPGILATQDTMIQAALDAGAQFVAVGADVLILSQTARNLSEKWKTTSK